jgi:3',5'-cyclic AMP phosphodiesterase CpdA
MPENKCAASIAAIFCLLGVAWAENPGSFRCAVIGDTGTGGRIQFEVGGRLADFQTTRKFGSVIMLGDNLYGSQKPKDFREKFELPYARLLDAGVNFYAVLGNHDEPGQRFYKPFNMEGRRYYTFSPHEGVRFFGLDSTRLDQDQLAWLKKELDRSAEDWKIVFCHHPMYSSGARHGSNLPLRAALEPLLVKHGVAAVLAGHDHFYERTKPQKTVTYFVVGGAAKLRAGNARRTEITAAAFDRDNSFLLLEIDKDALHFQAVSRTGDTVDAGFLEKPSIGGSVQTGASPIS